MLLSAIWQRGLTYASSLRARVRLVIFGPQEAPDTIKEVKNGKFIWAKFHCDN